MIPNLDGISIYSLVRIHTVLHLLDWKILHTCTGMISRSSSLNISSVSNFGTYFINWQKPVLIKINNLRSWNCWRFPKASFNLIAKFPIWNLAHTLNCWVRLTFSIQSLQHTFGDLGVPFAGTGILWQPVDHDNTFRYQIQLMVWNQNQCKDLFVIFQCNHHIF